MSLILLVAVFFPDIAFQSVAGYRFCLCYLL
jgi:hypothetical protein